MLGLTDQQSGALESQGSAFPRFRGASGQSKASRCSFLPWGSPSSKDLLLTPLCLKHIDYKLFGAWLATGQMLSWVSLLDPGVNEVLRQRVAHAFGGGHKQSLGIILGSGLVVGFFIAVIPTAAGLAAAFVAPRFVLLNHAQSAELRKCFLAAACGTGLTIASFSPGSALQGLQRHVLHGTVSMLGALSYLISAILLLYAGWGLAAIPAALLIRGAVWIVGWTTPVLWISKRELGAPLQMEWAEGRQTLGKSAATGLSNVGVTLQTGTDVFIAGAMMGPESAAMLSLTGALGDFIRLVPDRIVASFLPGMAHLAGEGDLDKFRTISWRLVQVILALLALAVGSVVVVNETFVDHWGGREIVRWLGADLGLVRGRDAFQRVQPTGRHSVFPRNYQGAGARPVRAVSVSDCACLPPDSPDQVAGDSGCIGGCSGSGLGYFLHSGVFLRRAFLREPLPRSVEMVLAASARFDGPGGWR